MAYINVAEWLTDQVTDWLKGLDNSMYHYINSFTNNEVRGEQLLNIRPYELEQLGMYSIGHQEIVLEAVEHLRNFHYHLDKENLQFLALHVATASQCLHNQLDKFKDKSTLETQILSDVTRTIATIKPLIGWLDRSPFHRINQFVELRNKMLRYAIEMATIAQRDRFVEHPVDQLKSTALRVAKLANYIIQDVSDVMILQPATLNLVTLKKKESELGFNIVPSYHGIHVVTDIKFNSPAHTSGKIEEGDEIIQINYQTVVGWQYKKVIHQLQESAPDILMTLKKRPKHSKIYGPIYMKPYRLPSKKKVQPSRWGADNLSSPRTDLLPTKDFPLPLCQTPEKHQNSSDSDCSDILTPTEPKVSDKDLRLYLPKPRAVLQRRNTICGDQVSGFKSNVMFWQEFKNRTHNNDSPSLRDKSVSFGFGLEIAPRPTTCLGIGNACAGKFNDFGGLKGSLPEITGDKIKPEEASKVIKPSKPGVSKVVRFDSNKKFNEYKDNKYACNVENTILEVFEPIPYVDDDETEAERKSVEDQSSNVSRMGMEKGLAQAVNEAVVQREIYKWEKCNNKSRSTPAYGDSDDDSDIPPAIEPRIEFLLKTPPAPPPRPRKLANTSPSPPSTVPLLSSYANSPPTTALTQSYSAASSSLQQFVKKSAHDVTDENKSKVANVIDLKRINQSTNFSADFLEADQKAENDCAINAKIPSTKHFLEQHFIEELELLTPSKTKNLTLKKKNSILAKRRNITLKTLEVSDIQGHLYRRSKDKHGVTYWAKLYFVLTDTSLYGFKSKDSEKAHCLIFLTGFTVSQASEVHSKPYAFKVYHPTKTFYFAAESQQALSQWMDYIKQATIKGVSGPLKMSNDHIIKELFSETESSDDELDFGGPKHLGTPSPSAANSLGRFGQKKNPASGSTVTVNSTDDSTTTTVKYHLGFNSLKKFTKQNLPFTSKNSAVKDKKTAHSDVPIPTAQFRSYRKVPGNAGLQLGTNSMISNIGNADFVPPLLSSIEPGHARSENLRKASITSLVPLPAANALPDFISTSFKSQREIKVKPKKLRKTSPYHYIHASNPNLVEFDFPTSKTLDYSFPKVNPSNSWDSHHSLQGFVTLKDLMLQKQEEDAKEMYNNRVNMGVEKKNDSKAKRRLRRTTDQSLQSARFANNEDQYGGSEKSAQSYNKIQMRSLPKTPDYAQSFKPDDSDIIMTRSREGQKLRDFGYEFISGDDPPNSKLTSANQAAALRSASTALQQSSTRKKSGLNWINTERRLEDDKSSRGGSFKKSKNKLVTETLESFKTSSEKLLQFKYASNNKDPQQLQKPMTEKSPLKPVTSFLPLTLPLKKSSSQVYNVQHPGDDNIMVQLPIHQPSGVSVRKSSTYNSPSEFNEVPLFVDNMRKNSAPERSASYFTKLTFTTSKSAKEKKLLGSPRLHRALFGRRESTEAQSHDHEIFSPIDFKPRVQPADATEQLPISLSQSQSQQTQKTAHAFGSPDYPNLEYPPVFEPETYSLSDPNTSLLRRRNHK